MREREKKWRKKTQAQGRKQIACWLDGDTYQALQALIQAHNLRGMGEAIRLLVDSHQAAQTPVQGRDSEDLGQSTQTQAEPGPGCLCPAGTHARHTTVRVPHQHRAALPEQDDGDCQGAGERRHRRVRELQAARAGL